MGRQSSERSDTLPNPEPSKTQLKIYGFAPSTYTKTALLVAAELGVDAALAPLEFKQASHFALHPYGKMPVLEDGNVKLFETLAIATYLDRVYGDGRLQPKGAQEHARMLQWVSAAIDYAYEDLVAQLHDEKPAPEAIAGAAEQLKLLDGALGDTPYFAGAELSLADLVLYPMVEFAVRKVGEASLGSLPSLSSWRARLAKRPSVKKAA